MTSNEEFVKQVNEKYYGNAIDSVEAIVNRKKVVTDELTYSLLHVVYDLEEATYDEIKKVVGISDYKLVNELEKLVNKNLIGRVPGREDDWKKDTIYDIKSLGKLEVHPVNNN